MLNQFHAVAVDRRANQIVAVYPAADLVTAIRGCRLLSKLGQDATLLVTSRDLRALAAIDADDRYELTPEAWRQP